PRISLVLTAHKRARRHTHNNSFPRLLLFHHHDPHRTLHSFPTRRSSDLEPGLAGTVEEQRVVEGPQERRCGIRRVRNGGRSAVRSEEHTSELQSLRHLVCRLLLEKKNQHLSILKESSNADPKGLDECQKL